MTLQVQWRHQSLRGHGREADDLQRGMTGSGTCPGRGQSPSPRSRRSPFPSHQGQSLSEGAGQRRESELGEGGALGSTGRAPGARGGVSYLGPGGRRDFGLRTGVSSGTGPAGINPPLEGLPPPAHPPPPTAAGPERGFEAGRPGSALGYRPRLLAAAATAAAGTVAAGHPPLLLLRQLLLLLLPPPPPPRPHRSHRRCGDYCSARWPDPTLLSPFTSRHNLTHWACLCARPPLHPGCWLESAAQACHVVWLIPLPIMRGAESQAESVSAPYRRIAAIFKFAWEAKLPRKEHHNSCAHARGNSGPRSSSHNRSYAPAQRGDVGFLKLVVGAQWCLTTCVVVQEKCGCDPALGFWLEIENVLSRYELTYSKAVAKKDPKSLALPCHFPEPELPGSGKLALCPETPNAKLIAGGCWGKA